MKKPKKETAKKPVNKKPVLAKPAVPAETKVDFGKDAKQYFISFSAMSAGGPYLSNIDLKLSKPISSIAEIRLIESQIAAEMKIINPVIISYQEL